MKRNALTALAALLVPLGSRAKGPLEPPAGPPAASMRSLQEIWTRVGTLETQLSTAQADLTLTLNDLTRVRSDNQLLTALLSTSATGIALPWNLATVDDVGSQTSLAFAPDGNPCLSYLDGTNNNLKFARFNGSIWTSVIVDPGGVVGDNSSLAFGPDGQPAISYSDAGNSDLKFARKGVFKPVP